MNAKTYVRPDLDGRPMKGALIAALAWRFMTGMADAGEPPVVVATVGGDSITTSELNQAIGASLFTLETEAYNQKVKILNQLIDQRLERDEAAARKVTVEALEKTEIEDKVAPVSDVDVNATYERVKARFPGKSEGEIKALIGADIKRRNEQVRRNEFLRGLRSKTSSRILLDPPRLEVGDGGGPSKGPKDAPVTMIEFSDFQCPYCGRAAPVVKRLADAYGDNLRLVFRNFPLSIHPQAPKAAEAAACARDQGKFWEMHARLFAHQDKMQVADLKTAAAEIGLDPQAFEECLDSGRHETVWTNDQKEAEGYGVSATPWFFINGRAVSGAQPYESFAKIIDDELQRRGVAGNRTK
jgi:predicted DsbA family dithiol-disulfide isomerase